MSSKITRRDFVNGVLAGSGTALLSSAALCPYRQAHAQSLDADWSGPGGVGDYANHNGNTADVVNAAHGIRDDLYAPRLKDAEFTGETFDYIVVGGGFSGFSAVRTFKREDPGAHILLLENHGIFGGEARLNEFVVNGVRLIGAQGSNAVPFPDSIHRELGYVPNLWDELNLPVAEELQFAKLEGTSRDIKFADDNYGGMMKWPERCSFGYFYGDATRGYEMVADAQANNFENAPLDPEMTRDFAAVLNNARLARTLRAEMPDLDVKLDSMSYAELLSKELGAPQKLIRYIDPYLASALSGTASSGVSALAALDFRMPGTYQFLTGKAREAYFGKRVRYVSFPGGNTQVLRHLVKDVIPDAISGDKSFEDIFRGTVRFGELDRTGSNVRIRLGATVVSVVHRGMGANEHVEVTYYRDGTLQKVRARGVVSAAGQWVGKHFLRDAPSTIVDAADTFTYGPVMVVNIALTNWRFMDNLGISGARWENGFGWFGNIRRPMHIGSYRPALNPSLPALMTLYVAFVERPELPLKAHAAFNRQRLFSSSYGSIEKELREQLQSLFKAGGFDWERDVAGVVTNRWGHAYVAAHPGFFTGRDGRPAAREAIRAGYGAVRIGHADLTGAQYWYGGVLEGERAARQLLEITA